MEWKSLKGIGYNKEKAYYEGNSKSPQPSTEIPPGVSSGDDLFDPSNGVPQNLKKLYFVVWLLWSNNVNKLGVFRKVDKIECRAVIKYLLSERKMCIRDRHQLAVGHKPLGRENHLHNVPLYSHPPDSLIPLASLIH